MKNRFDYQLVVLGFLATLILAGLFYLPYLSVHTKTVDAFRLQQTLLAQQAEVGLQEYLATYDTALTYLVQQAGIQELDESGKSLLRDFLSMRGADVLAIERTDAAGTRLFTVPETTGDDQSGVAANCQTVHEQNHSRVSDLYRLGNGDDQIFFSAAVRQEGEFYGCLSFSLPITRVAQRIFDQISFPHEKNVLLINQSGVILAAPVSSLIGNNIQHVYAGGEDNVKILRAALESSEQKLITLSENRLTQDLQNPGRVYGLVYPLELAADTRWSLVLLTPEHVVLGSMAEFRSQWLVVTAVAVTIVALLSFILSRIVVHKKEESQQRAAQKQLAMLLDLAPMGVFVLDAKATVLYANQEALRILEVNGEEVVGHRFLSFFHQGTCHDLAEQFEIGAAVQSRYQCGPIPLRTFSGSNREVVIHATLYQADPHPQWIFIVRDVTDDRIRAAQQQRLTAAIDQVKEAVLIADRQGVIDYANAALVEMTGYSMEECRGQSIRMLWAKEQDPSFDLKIENVVDGDEVWRGRIINQRKDGTRFIAAATISPMRSTNGTVAHFVLVQRDVTQELELDSRLRQTQKMEAIGTLAGGIAHDFNNILGGIIGFTDLALLQSTPGTEVHTNLLHIRQGGKRAADLVQQILTFSRQSVIEKVPVPVAPLIKESLRLLRASLPTTIDIVQDIPAPEAKMMVMAAPVQIQQIVMNLCTNAFYAMRETGGSLVIRLRSSTARISDQNIESNGRGQAVLVVEDTGQGIGEEILSRIFTPFFTTKQPGEGTGMGLSVVHGIVQELGGHIDVQSKKGEGTVFTVYLPLVGQSGSNGSANSPGLLSTGTEHILVVDDEKEIRETYKMMLSHLGYTVTTTGDPQEVVFLMEHAQEPIDLVLTDQTMPRMTGIDLTRNLRRNHFSVPVILCTGYSDRLNYDIALEAGASDLLMKPMDLQGLSVAVRAALDRIRGG
ncbi:MAG: PAS domain S-box protein [Desulfobulbus sp.]|nr:PAS domain S-box protein [Desulfobulbus sp.]